MPRFIAQPAVIDVPGGKVIHEHVGRVASGDSSISVARMQAPSGWDEPAQRPEFDEITLVLRGSIIVEHDEGRTEVSAGQSIVTAAGERIRYAAGPDGAEYIAVCTPAFAPQTVHREEE